MGLPLPRKIPPLSHSVTAGNYFSTAGVSDLAFRDDRGKGARSARRARRPPRRARPTAGSLRRPRIRVALRLLHAGSPAIRKTPRALASTPPASAGVFRRAAFLSAPRPVVKPTAPQRYRVQFTIDQETHDEFRRLQALLRREIPDGDPAVIFKRAVKLMLEKVENKKLGITQKPRRAKAIRPGTDKPRPRTAPRAVKRVIWRKDVGQCAFVAPDGRRCSEKAFLEFHHVHAHAFGGPPTVGNISLRCWRHNQYEAEVVFGRRQPRWGETEAPDP